MIKKVYKYNKSVSKNYMKILFQSLKIIGICVIITIVLSMFELDNVFLMILPIIISPIIAIIYGIVSLSDIGNVNYIYAIDDTNTIYIINAIVNSTSRLNALSGANTLNENSSKTDFVDSIILNARGYFPEIKHGILRNPDYSNPYIVKEILKVHSFKEDKNSIIVKCDYTIINGTPENNKVIEIPKSYNDWEELLEILKSK